MAHAPAPEAPPAAGRASLRRAPGQARGVRARDGRPWGHGGRARRSGTPRAAGPPGARAGVEAARRRTRPSGGGQGGEGRARATGGGRARCRRGPRRRSRGRGRQRGRPLLPAPRQVGPGRAPARLDRQLQRLPGRVLPRGGPGRAGPGGAVSTARRVPRDPVRGGAPLRTPTARSRRRPLPRRRPACTRSAPARRARLPTPAPAAFPPRWSSRGAPRTRGRTRRRGAGTEAGAAPGPRVGRDRSGLYAPAVEEYAARLARHLKFELVEVPEARKLAGTPRAREEEGASLLARIEPRRARGGPGRARRGAHQPRARRAGRGAGWSGHRT